MIGERLGPYAIDREVGAGGMGTVYRATGPDGVVALKIVHDRMFVRSDAAERFQREIEIGKTVRHENVVRTFDGGEIDGQHFLAMEYVEGQTLAELLVELERVPEELCRHIGREVSKGLAAIHAAGAIHRDMKPENVLITPDHVVKIMDLGVALLADEAQRLSQTGMFVGSLYYAAPEQFQRGGKDLDGRVDLHALGLVLYELASGVCPYFADDVVQTIQKVTREEPRKLGDVNPQLSPFFEEAVHTLLEKEREKRFSSADELAVVLAEGEECSWWRARSRALRAATQRPLRRIRIPRETAVYGREDELTRLRSLYERASSGDGQVLLVGGEAGIGKSRLVDELIGRLLRDGEDVNFLFGSYPPGGAATAAGAFSTAYREQLGEAGSAEYIPTTPILVPAFDALLRGEPSPLGEVPLVKDSLQTCFVNATRALAVERTTVVLIDDLHFAPGEGRALFAALAMAVPGHRVLLIGTLRPGLPEAWLAGLDRFPQTHRLELSRLGPRDLGELLQETLGSARLARELALQIGTKSDGNPFFVFEILRGLRDGRFLTQKADGSWATTGVLAEIRIPSSVLDLVSARVADLDDDERNLLDIAACWGFEFDPVLVGAVLGMSRIPALQAFGRIEKRHRLARSAGRHYVFDHHQVQEALYEALHEQLREEYHAALAEALESRTEAAQRDPDTLDGALAVDLCEQFLQGARGEAALRYLPIAQTHLQRNYLHGRSVALVERALAVPDLLRGAERGTALLRLCGPLNSLGRRARQGECAQEAARLAEEAGDDELLRRAMQALGTFYFGTSRHDDAERTYGRALEIARARGDREGESAALGSLGGVFEFQGRLAEAQDYNEQNLEISREIGDSAGEARATGNLGNVLQGRGDLAGAMAHHQRRLALSREMGDRRGEAAATGNLGNAFQSLGRLAEAREHIERYLALSREIGYRLGEAIAQHNLGVVLREQREEGHAEERFVACLDLCAEIGQRHLAAGTHLMLGSLRAARGLAAGGSGADGRESLETARDLATENRFPAVATMALCELACLAGHDAADALAAFTDHEKRLSAVESREARYLLWKATGDRTHLEAAKRVLDAEAALVDDDIRATMLGNNRVNREITAACRVHGI